MSISGSDPPPLAGDGDTPQSLLACLSQTVNKISRIEAQQPEEEEKKKLVEMWSFLYRFSPVIKMLQGDIPEEILESVSRRIQLANDFLDGAGEMHLLVNQMEGMIHYLGEDLASIPTSTFAGREYAEIAVRSLSREMRAAQLQTATTATEEPTPTLRPETQVDLYPVPAREEVSGSVTYSSGEPRTRSGASPDVARYVEPPFGGFFCPLTHKILEDPVTIQSGATFERDAIAQWFQTQPYQGEVTCPATGRKLSSRVMFPNMALKSVVDEWKERNDKEKIKVIHAALSLASSETMIIGALNDLNAICRRRPDTTRQVLDRGFIPLVVSLLEHKDSMIRRATLETLQRLAEEDNGKELIGQTEAISLIVRMTSSRFQPIKHASLLLLLELSNSVALLEKIGKVTGAILMLIRTKYDRSTDMFASEAASQVLKNLAQFPYNLKCMAENGFFEPLLENLAGSETMKAEMASYLAEFVLCHNDSAFVVGEASPTLIQMTSSDNASIRKAALKALVPISSLHQNAKMLVEAGVARIVWEEMFTRNSHFETSDALSEAVGILANLLESDLDLEKVELTSQGHTITSDHVASSIVYMLLKSCNVDEINLGLVRTISCIMKWSMSNIVSAIGDSEAWHTLLELINSPDEQLGVAVIKLVIQLAQHVGPVLVDKLCKIYGQPYCLVQRPPDMAHITERQVLSVKLLATLPHDDLQLNLSLLGGNTAATVIQTIKQIQETGARKGRYASDYLEGLIGILVRFTATLYEPEVMHAVVSNDFTTVLKDLLTETTSGEVKRLAATGLEKLSAESAKLSKPVRKVSMAPRFLASRSSSKQKTIKVCSVHRGVCSAQSTFCLVVSGAMEALLFCLDHEDAGVVEASLSALLTLVDDNVDVKKSVRTLHEVKATQLLLKLVREHAEEGVLHKALWMIERFLCIGGDGDEFGAVALRDRKFNSKLVNSFYHGDADTRLIAKKILTHLGIMPGSSVIFS